LNASLPEQALRLLRDAGMAGAEEVPPAVQLGGGVSSEIWRVELAKGPVCIKRALPRLRVAQVWEAPVERNRYEFEWLRLADQAVPGAAPKVFVEGDGAFAMQCLELPVWKETLRQGQADPRFAAAVGRTLAAIHSSTQGKPEVARLFPTDEIFYAIRLEPYLVATAARHRDLEKQLRFLLKRTAETKTCLVHGDVSPKNILVGPGGPVFLDAECAWYGDPAFDIAFCLNHLLLKCLWVPRHRAAYLACFDAFVDAYNPRDSEARAASLLPALLLARVDGKSPVEYLNPAQQDRVRRTARPLVAAPPQTLKDVRKAWQESLT
jgi:aminoglycoside phosphotransferase (APT) family kinase protein